MSIVNNNTPRPFIKYRPAPVHQISSRARIKYRPASALRVLTSKTADDRLSRSLSLKISFPAQSFVSRSSYSSRAVHRIRIPPICIFLFCYAGETRWQW
jgi:hypothetical protein